MKLIEKYNSLHTKKVDRISLESFQQELNRNLHLGCSEISLMFEKITKLLNQYPDAKYFTISLSEIADKDNISTIAEFEKLGIPFIQDQIQSEGLSKPVSSEQIYQIITDKVLAMINSDKGFVWRKPWSIKSTGKARNFKTKTIYRGINSFLLNQVARYERGKEFKSPYFLTFNQIKELKGKLKKGSNGYIVVYFSKIHKIVQENPKLSFSSSNEKKFNDFIYKNEHLINDTSQTFTIPVLKYYKVFSADDISGIKFPKQVIKTEPKFKEIEIAESMINSFPNNPNQPKIHIEDSRDRAFYRSSEDSVTMPKKSYFDNEQFYYSVLFHELIHATGHNKRLNRKKGNVFGSPEYAFEELIAEFGAIFLSAEAGILYHTLRNSTTYIKGWKSAMTKEMKKNNKFFFRAISQAQRATDYFLNKDANGDPKYLKSLLEAQKTQPKSKEKPIQGEQLTLQGLYGVANSKKLSGSDIRKLTLEYVNTILNEDKTAIDQIIKSIKVVEENVKDGKLKNLPKNQLVKVNKNIISIIKRSTYNKWTQSAKQNIFGYFTFKSSLTTSKIKKFVFVKVVVFKNSQNHVDLVVEGLKTPLTNIVLEPEQSPLKQSEKSIVIEVVNNHVSEDLPKVKEILVQSTPIINPTKELIKSEVKTQILKPKLNSTHTSIPFKSSLDRLNEKVVENQLFNVPNDYWKKFLGKIEKKPKQSLLISLDSEEGGGKTHTSFQFANALASGGNKVIFWSLEEEASSNSTKNKERKYFEENNLERIFVESDSAELSKEENYHRIIESIKYFDVIIIDSWAKVLELNSKANLDQEFRKAFNGKIFLVIFQRTVDGKMRGGSKSAYDADIVLKGVVDRDNFKNNFFFNHKNRYNDYNPLKDLRYSPYYQCLVPENKEEIVLEI